MLEARILGCGSSGGVPRLGGEDEAGAWGACDPANPKNRRRRCSILVERRGAAGTTTVLIDTSPDLREQLLDADTRRLERTTPVARCLEQEFGFQIARTVDLTTLERDRTFVEGTGSLVLDRPRRLA